MKKLFIFSLFLFFGLFFDRLNIFKYCILSSIAHECGHIVTYIILMRKLPEIDVSIFGFKMKNNILNDKHLSRVLISGPLVNLFLAIGGILKLSTGFSVETYVFIVVNIIIFTVNILPVFYMDGGQLLYLNSKFYREHYRLISAVCVIVIFIILFCSTGIKKGALLSAGIFMVYFLFNLSIDIWK